MTRAVALLLLMAVSAPVPAAESGPVAFGPPGTALPDGAKYRLGRPTEHTSTVLAFSADGKTLAAISNRGYVGGIDAPVELWNADTGGHVRTLRYHKTGVMAAAFSPDGAVVATSGIDNRLRFWDGKTGKDITAAEHIGLTGHGYNLTFSPDGKRLLVGSTKLELYDVRTQKPVKKEFFAETGTNMFFHVATWSPKGKYVAAACDGGGVRVWDAETGNLVHKLDARYTAHRTRFAFSSDDELLLVSAWPDGLFKVFDAATGKERNALKAPDGEVSPEQLQFAREMGRVARVVQKQQYQPGRTVAVSDATGDELKRFDLPAGIASLLLSNDGKRLAVGGTDGSLRVYASESGRLERTLLGAWAPVFRTVYAGGGKVLRTVHSDGTVHDFDADTGKHLKERRLPLEKSTFLLTTSADGTLLASSSEAGELAVWDLNTAEARAQPKGKLHGHREMIGGRPAPIPLPGGPLPPAPAQPAPGGDSANPPVAARRAFPPPGGPMRPPPPPFNPQPGPPQFFAAFSADGRRVAAVTGDFDAVTVWDTTTGEEKYALTVPKGTRALAFTPDGAHLYAGSPFGRDREETTAVRRFGLKTGKEVQSWKAGEQRPNLNATRTEVVALYPLADKETLLVVEARVNDSAPPPFGRPGDMTTTPRGTTVRVIDLAGRKKDRTTDVGVGPLVSAPEGKWFGFVTTDTGDPNKPVTAVKAVDATTGSVKALTVAVGYQHATADALRGVTFRPGGTDLAVRFGDGTVLVVDGSKLREVKTKVDGKKE